MKKAITYKTAMCALFAALTAVFSQIAIPIGPVPINLATLAVFCAGALLGPSLGALSLAIYVIIGAAGAPVFSLFRGGIGILTGPTGGYIVGYIPAAFIVGLLIEKLNKSKKIYIYPAAMLCGMLTYFILGTAWFMFSTGTGFLGALMVCVVPFLPGDFLKIAVATMLAKRLSHVFRRLNN